MFAGFGRRRLRFGFWILWGRARGGFFLLIVGLVEAASFEYNAASRSDEAVEFHLAALWTFFQAIYINGLDGLKFVAASGAFVLVGGHGSNSISKSGHKSNVIRCLLTSDF